jgi:hypothetical protein
MALGRGLKAASDQAHQRHGPQTRSHTMAIGESPTVAEATQCGLRSFLADCLRKVF